MLWGAGHGAGVMEDAGPAMWGVGMARQPAEECG